MLNPAAIIEVNQSFHSVSAEIFFWQLTEAHKKPLENQNSSVLETMYELLSLSQESCFLQGSVAGKVFNVPLNGQKSKCDIKLRKMQIQGHRLVEITNACSLYFLYGRKTHACFAMYGVL